MALEYIRVLVMVMTNMMKKEITITIMMTKTKSMNRFTLNRSTVTI